MNLNLNDLHSRLIASARNNPPAGQVPCAFEKRIMATLAGRAPLNAWTWWGHSLWRAAASCAVITVLCGIWSFSSTPRETSDSFSQDFERAVFAPMNQHVEESW